jgi:uncharacterized Zn-binding protein involved in type VI secretion
MRDLKKPHDSEMGQRCAKMGIKEEKEFRIQGWNVAFNGDWNVVAGPLTHG